MCDHHVGNVRNDAFLLRFNESGEVEQPGNLVEPISAPGSCWICLIRIHSGRTPRVLGRTSDSISANTSTAQASPPRSDASLYPPSSERGQRTGARFCIRSIH